MTPPADDRETLRRLRLANRLGEEQLRAARLAHARRRAERRQLTEAVSLDWVTPYAELLDRFRSTGDPVFAGPSSFWHRRYGKDWPVFQTEQELALLRAPSRLLCATSDDAAGLVTGVGAYVVGAGYTYRPAKRHKASKVPDELIAELQLVVDAVLGHNEWAGGEQYGIEPECFWRSLEDGEFVLTSHPRADGLTDFEVQEPEALTQPPGESGYDWTFGVCAEPDRPSRPLAYWLQRGDTPADGEEFAPDEILHFKRNGRRSQKRGRPDFTFQMFDKVSLAGKIRVNLSESAAQQSSIVGVRQHDSGSKEEVQAFNDTLADFTTTDPLSQTQQNVRQARRGGWEDIPKGMIYVDGPGAPYADQHLAILSECLRGAVTRWNGFEWLISANAGNNNLPVDLSAESPFVRRVLQEHNRYTGAFKKPVWLAVRHHVETKGLYAAGRAWAWDEIAREVDLLVEAPSPETRNKLEETQRFVQELAAGVDSRQRFAQAAGRDWDQVQADNAQYEREHPQQPGQQDPAGGGGGLFDGAGRRKPVRAGGGGDLGGLLPESEEEPDAAGRLLLEHGAPPFPGAVFDESKHRWVKKDDAAPAGRPPAAHDWQSHPVTKKLAAGLKASKGLTDGQRAAYGKAAAAVLSKMPKAAHDRIEKNLKAAVFHPDNAAVGQAVLTEAAADPSLDRAGKAMVESLRKQLAGGATVGGAYMPGSLTVHADGGYAESSNTTSPSLPKNTTPHIYAHEWAHAIDGPAKEISGSPAWQAAFKAEFGNGRLTHYASVSPAEALAEFARLPYATGLPPAAIEKQFPRAVAVFKEHGLWPDQATTGKTTTGGSNSPNSSGGGSNSPAGGTPTSSSGPSLTASDGPPADHVLGGLADKLKAVDPEAAAKPGLMHRLGDKALTAAARVHLALIKATPAILKVMSLAGDVLDTPQDMAKIGYNPTMSSGTDRAGVFDPVRANLGVSTHFAATVATHVLSKALVWAKSKLSGGRTESEEGDLYAGAGEVLHQLLAVLAGEFGLADPPAADVIAAHLRTLAA